MAGGSKNFSSILTRLSSLSLDSARRFLPVTDGLEEDEVSSRC
jgi:hypothetical protein